MYVYPGVPPEAATFADPELPPLHNTGFTETDAVNTGGCMMVTEAVAVQLFASVTVTVYDPAMRPLPVVPVPPDGVHAYV